MDIYEVMFPYINIWDVMRSHFPVFLDFEDDGLNQSAKEASSRWVMYGFLKDTVTRRTRHVLYFSW